MRPRSMPGMPQDGYEERTRQLERTVHSASAKRCPHSRGACEYFPKNGFEARSRDINILMHMDPRDLPGLFVSGNGRQKIQKIPFPRLKDLCDTCTSSPRTADTKDTYTVEKLDDINGSSPFKRGFGGDIVGIKE